MEQERGLGRSQEYLSNSPRKGIATWPSADKNKDQVNNHNSEVTEHSNLITPRQNHVAILLFGSCLPSPNR